MPHHANSKSFSPGHKLSKGRPLGAKNKKKVDADLTAVCREAFDLWGGALTLSQEIAKSPEKFLPSLLSNLVRAEIARKEKSPVAPEFHIHLNSADKHGVESDE